MAWRSGVVKSWQQDAERRAVGAVATGEPFDQIFQAMGCGWWRVFRLAAVLNGDIVGVLLSFGN